MYKRNRIERCFSKLKHFRRFATRYEKTNKTSKIQADSKTVRKIMAFSKKRNVASYDSVGSMLNEELSRFSLLLGVC